MEKKDYKKPTMSVVEIQKIHILQTSDPLGGGE